MPAVFHLKKGIIQWDLRVGRFGILAQILVLASLTEAVRKSKFFTNKESSSKAKEETEKRKGQKEAHMNSQVDCKQGKQSPNTIDNNPIKDVHLYSPINDNTNFHLLLRRTHLPYGTYSTGHGVSMKATLGLPSLLLFFLLKESATVTAKEIGSPK